MDVFDGLPDPIVIDILNKVGDVKTLLRCTSLSKRFNLLVPQSESLILRLNHVNTTTEPDSPVGNIFRSLFKSFHGLFSLFSKPTKPNPITTLSPNIPSKILSRFNRINNLDVELPGGDVKVEKDAVVKWKAEFGKTLKSCVVVAFRSAATVSSSSSSPEEAVHGESDAEFVNGLKTRVVWTISALMAASSRHYLMNQVVKEHEEMESLVMRDREGEGTVVMELKGLREYRMTAAREEDVERVERNRRSVVPSVRMSMRHAPSLKLKNGISLESATLVIVRPSEEYSDVGDDEMATEAFAGDCMYVEAVGALLKRKKNNLEMNSF